MHSIYVGVRVCVFFSILSLDGNVCVGAIARGLAHASMGEIVNLWLIGWCDGPRTCRTESRIAVHASGDCCGESAIGRSKGHHPPKGCGFAATVLPNWARAPIRAEYRLSLPMRNL